MSHGPKTALERRESRLSLLRREPEWQRVWLNLEAEQWSSLAVIPTGDLSSIELVHGLASVAWQQRGTRIIVADLRSIVLSALSSARVELKKYVDSGNRVIVALGSLDACPTTAAIARDVDKALLCVHLERARTAHVRNALKQLGRHRFLGAVLVSRETS